MSIVTESLPTPTAPTRPVNPRLKVTGPRVARAEWAKLWSLRSTPITLGIGLMFLLAFGVISALQYKSQLASGHPTEPQFASYTTYTLALYGFPFTLVALGVLGVLTSAGEYSTGMIRSTMSAVPRRLPVLWAKATVYGALTFGVSAVGATLAFLIGSQVLSGTSVAMNITDHGVALGLLGVGVDLGLVGVIGVALGVLLRPTPGGISALVGTFLLAPQLMRLLPQSWQGPVTEYLPSNAGDSIYALHHIAGTLSAGAGLLVLLGWTALALGAAAYRLTRTDV